MQTQIIEVLLEDLKNNFRSCMSFDLVASTDDIKSFNGIIERDLVLRCAARLIGRKPKYASFTAYMRPTLHWHPNVDLCVSLFFTDHSFLVDVYVHRV